MKAVIRCHDHDANNAAQWPAAASQLDAAAAQALVAMMPVSTMVATAPAVVMTSVPAMVAMMPTMMTAHMAMTRVAMARAHIGCDTIRDMPRSGSARVNKRESLSRPRWRSGEQKSRNCEKAENLFHECPLLDG
ncbi:hypothetical protein ASC80_19450 [Afipia sp. Root123D2]|uniref:hypothetical protein n=1 Tax=Afipia sp. Root123D2 TaxID=1736436 RepID=UPI0006F33C5F|nr:hypothetical protein [Afipia sp. Root123D2]KQW19526.1 hypothetical protein ASC80_19450 [Afipia sp. Root123D2]